MFLWGIRYSEFSHYCVHGGIRNSECFPVFLGGSEILNPAFLWGIRNSESCVGEIRNSESCVLGGIRNSECFLVFLGGSEILNPVFLWGVRNSECFLCSWGNQKF